MTYIFNFFIIIPIINFILLAINFIFALQKPYKEKKTPFECGYHSFLSQNRTQFTISFFIFGLLFLLFDIEIVSIYPLTVSSYFNGGYGIFVIIIFILVLTLGFVFELGKGALVIDTKQEFKFLHSSISTVMHFTLVTIYCLEQCKNKHALNKIKKISVSRLKRYIHINFSEKRFFSKIIYVFYKKDTRSIYYSPSLILLACICHASLNNKFIGFFVNVILQIISASYNFVFKKLSFKFTFNKFKYSFMFNVIIWTISFLFCSFFCVISFFTFSLVFPFILYSYYIHSIYRKGILNAFYNITDLFFSLLLLLVIWNGLYYVIGVCITIPSLLWNGFLLTSHGKGIPFPGPSGDPGNSGGGGGPNNPGNLFVSEDNEANKEHKVTFAKNSTAKDYTTEQLPGKDKVLVVPSQELGELQNNSTIRSAVHTDIEDNIGIGTSPYYRTSTLNNISSMGQYFVGGNVEHSMHEVDRVMEDDIAQAKVERDTYIGVISSEPSIRDEIKPDIVKNIELAHSDITDVYVENTRHRASNIAKEIDPTYSGYTTASGVDINSKGEAIYSSESSSESSSDESMGED